MINVTNIQYSITNIQWICVHVLNCKLHLYVVKKKLPTNMNILILHHLGEHVVEFLIVQMQSQVNYDSKDTMCSFIEPKNLPNEWKWILRRWMEHICPLRHLEVNIKKWKLHKTQQEEQLHENITTRTTLILCARSGSRIPQ